MNVLKEIQKGIWRCQYLLENDVTNAKRYKIHYREEVDILIAANTKFMDQSVKKLQQWCEISAIAWNIPQKGIQKLKRKLVMSIANNQIDKLSTDIFKCATFKEELDAIRSRFDGVIYLTI